MGWLAGKIMGGHGYGIVWDVVVVVGGAFGRGLAFSLLFSTQPTGIVIWFIVALIGAFIPVAVLHLSSREPIRTA